MFHPVFFIVNSRDIDNPLNPWVQVYKGELKLEEGAHFHDRPALDIVIRKFRTAKLTAYAAGLFFTVSKRFGTVWVLFWQFGNLVIDVVVISKVRLENGWISKQMI